MRVSKICSILLLFSMISITSITQDVFADHSEVTIGTVEKSGFSQDCVTDGCYTPDTATVDVGGKVIFSNTDTAGIHTFTAGTINGFTPSPTGEFDTSVLSSGEFGEWIPNSAGEVPYYCLLHPWMQGTIIVEGADSDDKAMMEKEAMEKEAMEKEAMEKEAMEKEAMEKEAMEKEAMEKEAMEKEAMEKEAMEKEAMEKEAMEKEAMEKEAMEKEAMEKEAMEKEAMEKDDDKMMDKEEGGGCLIATAAYGSELAPQVQLLREIRDNTVMSTTSGTAFMSGFNQLYYSFSPIIADLERENPMFRDAVRAFITPMVSTLSIMTLADNGSEVEVLGLGISVIALNLGMYIAAPALVGFQVNKIIKTRK